MESDYHYSYNVIEPKTHDKEVIPTKLDFMMFNEKTSLLPPRAGTMAEEGSRRVKLDLSDFVLDVGSHRCTFN